MPTGTQPLPGPLSQHVGRLLTELIGASGSSQAAVAGDAGMSPAQLSRALAGKKVFTLDQLDAVCTTLGADIVAVVSKADAATRARRTPPKGNVVEGRFGVRPADEDVPKAAKTKQRDRGGDDGQG